MDNLEKTIIGLAITLVIVIAIGYFVQTKNESSTSYNSIIMKAQQNFTTHEINAIEGSHLPFQINPANTLVFGNWKNTSQRICGQQQAYFSVENSSDLYILSNGFYVPTYELVKALGSSNLNLIGQKVYLSFYVYAEKTNVSAPYIVKSENIQGNEVIWNMTFDGNISNAINSRANYSTGKLTISWLNGIVLSNHTPIISPVNPDINFTAPNC